MNRITLTKWENCNKISLFRLGPRWQHPEDEINLEEIPAVAEGKSSIQNGVSKSIYIGT
jgi:hypothetical protein